jgi:hypothetical protein
MATRSVTLQAATLANVGSAALTRDDDGNVVIRMNVVSKDSPQSDVRTIALADTSLSGAQRTSFTDIWSVILSDLQSLPPSYS